MAHLFKQVESECIHPEVQCAIDHDELKVPFEGVVVGILPPNDLEKEFLIVDAEKPDGKAKLNDD